MSSTHAFFDIQTRTAWGRTLAGFADWLLTPTIPASARVLDVGCGPGLLPALLAARGCRACGVDLEYTAPAGRLHACLAQADALRLPFAPATFSLITASNVLFLLPDPQIALSDMARTLRPGGRLALLNPSEHMSVPAALALADARSLTGLDRTSLLGWAARAEAHHRWTEAETLHMVEAAGFQMVESLLKIGPGLARWTKAIKLKEQ